MFTSCLYAKAGNVLPWSEYVAEPPFTTHQLPGVSRFPMKQFIPFTFTLLTPVKLVETSTRLLNVICSGPPDEHLASQAMVCALTLRLFKVLEIFLVIASMRKP